MLLDPKNDKAFKKVFGSEGHKSVMIGFLNDILQPKAPITEITYLPTIATPTKAGLKASVVDVLCEDSEKNSYIVEMQVNHMAGFIARSLYYFCGVYYNQLQEGDLYKDLKPVYLIAITNRILRPESPLFFSRCKIIEETSGECLTDDLTLVYLELPKFKKKLKDLTSTVDRWCYFFKEVSRMNEKDAQSFLEEGPAQIREAGQLLERFSWTEAEYQEYTEMEKIQRDYAASLATAEQDGMEKGLEKGKAEEKKEIARNLKAQGIPPEIISTATGLSLAEIKKL